MSWLFNAVGDLLILGGGVLFGYARAMRHHHKVMSAGFYEVGEIIRINQREPTAEEVIQAFGKEYNHLRRSEYDNTR